ncbi:MAG: DegT/DnrJ/EryC1/StrS family aminotransferase, partial [Elusimicrobia bacterium]|nr:DegT/DnrJ/EryC1/StrS family aminotransferase [Elusimicrobiota bacterium]
SLDRQQRSLSRQLKRAVGQVLDSGSFILGAQGRAFEKEFAKLLGLPRVLGVDSGTSALELALKACGVGPGDEVIVPTFTFIATATAVSALGATPVFADIDWDTMTLSAEDARKRMTRRTKAIIPVHLFGQPADVDGLRRLKAGWLIEDCAQSHLAKYKGRPVGALGDASCFSFYPTKNLGAAGDAGAVAAADAGLLSALEELRNCGRKLGQAYRHARVGSNCRLDEIQAAVLRVKLKRLRRWTERRRALAAFYDEGLSGLPVTRPPLGLRGTQPVFHLYVLRTPRRDALLAHLKSLGIASGVYYPLCLHQQPAYSGLKSRRPFPNAERASREALALPLYPELRLSEAARVVAAVRAFFAA